MDAVTHYLLHLADNAVVLGQRNAEWCGHGPILEEDIAMGNISLDLIGQARLLYQTAAQRLGDGRDEDDLAYFRDPAEFRNFVLCELPHHGPLVGYAHSDRDYATTLVRNLLYSGFMVLLWGHLRQANPAVCADLPAIAAKSLKEATYHLHHAQEWLMRLGDGTDESHARAQAALDHLMPFTQELFSGGADEEAAMAALGLPSIGGLHATWLAMVQDTVARATLRMPSEQGYLTQGKVGLHSEHLSFLLAEMQSLARAHPEGVW